jgi:hypothetical protein
MLAQSRFIKEIVPLSAQDENRLFEQWKLYD